MGLDISAYRQLKGSPSKDRDADGPYVPSTNPEFKARTDGLEPGVYEDAAETFGFRAGSYSGYGEWRSELAKLAGWGDVTKAWDAEGGPFWELINFSDCEGCIGPKTSAKLAQDFAQFQEKADQHEDSWFRSKYADWRKAFEMASDGGAVGFH